MNINKNKMLIIGNGFDLNLGLPTRFSDFAFFCKNWNSFYNNFNKIKISEHTNFSKFDNKDSIIEFALNFNFDSVVNEIEYINENINKCLLFNFFDNYNSITAWNRFEHILQTVCNQIEYFCQSVVMLV